MTIFTNIQFAILLSVLFEILLNGSTISGNQVLKLRHYKKVFDKKKLLCHFFLFKVFKC